MTAENEASPVASVTHACPPDGSAVMPCCDRTPFDVPRTDRITFGSPDNITCPGQSEEARRG